jgi:DNA-binding CsgD family transcriptional regulator
MTRVWIAGKSHRARLMRRLGVRTIVEAVRSGTLARLAT